MKDKKIDKYIKEQSSKLTKGLIDRRQFMMSVLATGVTPRDIKLPIMEGTVSTKVSSYLDVLTGKVKVGRRVAIIGAGGIGFDTGEFILHQHQHEQIIGNDKGKGVND